MDYRKEEANAQFQALKRESEMTIAVLNKLLETCSTHLNNLDNMDSKGFRQYSKYYLAVLQFYYMSKQKIMEWNIDFDEFLEAQRIPQLEYYKSLVTINTSYMSDHTNLPSPTISYNTFSPPFTNVALTKEPNCLPNGAFLNKQESKKETINAEKSVIESAITPQQYNFNDSQKNYEPLSIKNVDNNIKPEINTFPQDLIKPINILNSTPNDDNDSVLTSHSCITLTSEICRNNSDLQQLDDTLNESFSSSSNYFSVASFIQQEATSLSDIEYTEPLPQKESEPINITERLKSLPVMSLREKFERSLPEPYMPNVNLQLPNKEVMKSNDKNINGDFIVNGGNHIDLEIDDMAHHKDVNKENKKGVKKYNTSFTDCSTEIKLRPPPQVGDTCMIGYADSPTQLYIQVVDDNSSLIDVLAVQLADLYDKAIYTYTSKVQARNKLGNFCSFKVENMWYRIEVLDWNMDVNDESVLIQLVDYGHIYTVQYEGLRPLLPDLRKLPKMAQKCHIGYLYPPGSTKCNKLKEWPVKSIDGLFDTIGDMDQTTFILQHVYYCNERMSYEIDLVKAEEVHKEKTIGQLLIDNGHAVGILDGNSEMVSNNVMLQQIQTAHGLTGITPDMSTNTILETYFKQDDYTEANDINEAVMNYNPRDEAETCRNLRADGTCYKGKSCRLRHVPLKHGFTRDRVPIYYKAFENEPLPTRGSEIFVTISHVVDIRHFYVQLKKDDRMHVFPKLKNLIDTMNNPVTIRQYEKLKDTPTPSQIIIAKHWNNYWYRAQVIAVHFPNNTNNAVVEVFIVDFGDVLEVPMSDLREIWPEFLEMGFQAIECRLFNVRHREGMDPEQEKKHVESYYLGQMLIARVMGTPGYLEIILLNNEHEDIGLKLIEDGFGELNTDHFFPKENDLILID